MSNSAPIVDRIRIIPRPTDFLDRNVGSSGEVFFSKETNSLRVYSGRDRSGFEIARADLTNVDTSSLLANVAKVRYTVTINNTGEGNKYILNGEYKPELNFVVGYTYIFDQSDSTNVYYPNPDGGTNNQHPLNFSADNLNGEIGGGTVYTTNVTYKLDNAIVLKQEYWNGFEQATQRSVEIIVTNETPSTLYYWCQNHLNMGNTITVANPGSTSSSPISSPGASVDVADNAPTEPEPGNLWLDTNTGKLFIYINDGDSSQWIQPKVTNSNISYDSLINKPVLATVATSGSYNDLTDKPDLGDGGFDGTFGALSGTPTTLSGYGITDAATSAQGTLADSAVQPADLTSYAQLSSATFSGLVTLQQTSEKLTTLTGATGVVEHDLDNGAVFNHTALAADFTANFTNVPTTADRTTSIVLVLNQGATAYIPTALQIDGVVQNINWQGAATPSGNVNQVDIVSFTLIRTGAAWTVIGSLTTYG